MSDHALLTMKEAQDIMRRGRAGVLKALESGRIAFHRITPDNPRSEYRINRQDVERFISRTSGNPATRPVIAKYPEQ